MKSGSALPWFYGMSRLFSICGIIHGVEGRRPCCLSTVDFRPALPAPDKELSPHPAVQFRLLYAFSHSPFPLVSGSILLPVRDS